jgi:glycosyltransferase involved in cell wall biosynthesis
MTTKILFWCDQFGSSVGGAEVWGLRYIAAMEDRGYELEVVVAESSEHAGATSDRIMQVSRTPIHWIPAGDAMRRGDCAAFHAGLARIATLVTAFRPNLLHLSTGMSVPSLSLLLMSQGLLRAHSGRDRAGLIGTLASLHCEWPDYFALAGSPLEHVLRRMDWTCSFSQSTLDWAQRQWPWLRNRSSVIPHAMPDRLESEPDRSPAPGCSPTIAFVGRLSREKGADLALEALDLIRRELPGVHLLVAGDGPQRAALEALTLRLGLADSVTFTGWLAPERVQAVMQSSDLVMIPSREESFSLVALEAAHVGRPVVATRVGGVPEVCIDEQTALLCPPEDTQALAAAALRLLRDRALSKRMGKAARARVRSSTTMWEEHMDAYVSLVERLAVSKAEPVELTTQPVPSSSPIL